MRIKREIQKTNLGIIGKIKVGDKKVNKYGKEYPVSLDHFRATANIQTIADHFYNIYDKTDTIPIAFATDDDDFNLINRYEIRDSSGKLYMYGDGETFFRSESEGFKVMTHDDIVKKNGDVATFMTKVKEYLSSQSFSPDWSEILTLRFMIYKIKVLGVWELTTKASKSSIQQIISSYDLTKEINGGRIEFVPFLLNVKKVKNARKMNQNRSYPVLSLTSMMTDESSQQLISSPLIQSISTSKTK